MCGPQGITFQSHDHMTNAKNRKTSKLKSMQKITRGKKQQRKTEFQEKGQRK